MSNTADKDKTTRPRWRRWLWDGLLILVVIVGVQLWQTRNLPSGPAPALEGVLPSGATASLKDYRGQPVLVHFWATWCPVCRAEQGSIEAISKDHQVLSVATTSGEAQEVSRYIRENHLDFPVILDEAGMLGVAWGIRGVPSSFIIDAHGQIRHAAVGYTTELGLRLRLWLAKF
ncbi:protein disulfide oxidoreductase [Thiolapillus sp.]